MRTLTISLVAASLGLGVAAPAAAQYNYYPAPAYTYQPYNYYGFNGATFARSMQDRVSRVRGDIRTMASRGVLTPVEFRRLDQEAWTADRYIQRAMWGGLYPAEAQAIERKVRRLEQNVGWAANNWNYRRGYRR
jgi:hypothetical protein